ncbi:D-alanyl-D-alanine carboxypeptidase [bacterium]|nr:MAG: D-alanyl-D-alanine carboxypeptidase [bacterium]
MKWQVILLVFLILGSAAFAIFKTSSGRDGQPAVGSQRADINTAVPGLENEIAKIPERNWSVLDPQVSAQSVVVQSLDDNFPFFRYNSYKMWPLASLTKLLTAVITIENIGLEKKVTVTPEVMAIQGEAGDLKAGEIYTARDLLKIMLMMSSNRAAAALENYLGHDQFIKMAMDKARAIGMTQTTIYDGSGLNDSNEGTASDISLLLKYILEKDPEILSYTRIPSLLVQPVNSERSHTVTNIDPLVNRADFLGGKTGTSEAAGQNLAAILSFEGKRVEVIILGSPDRFKETDNMLAWVKKAFSF